MINPSSLNPQLRKRTKKLKGLIFFVQQTVMIAQ